MVGPLGVDGGVSLAETSAEQRDLHGGQLLFQQPEPASARPPMNRTLRRHANGLVGHFSVSVTGQLPGGVGGRVGQTHAGPAAATTAAKPIAVYGRGATRQEYRPSRRTLPDRYGRPASAYGADGH